GIREQLAPLPSNVGYFEGHVPAQFALDREVERHRIRRDHRVVDRLVDRKAAGAGTARELRREFNRWRRWEQSRRNRIEACETRGGLRTQAAGRIEERC